MKIDSTRFSHPEIGREATHHIEVGRLHVSVSFGRGVYGFPGTPSIGLRMWVLRDRDFQGKATT